MRPLLEVALDGMWQTATLGEHGPRSREFLPAVEAWTSRGSKSPDAVIPRAAGDGAERPGARQRAVRDAGGGI
jgi:hypothetical protein